MPTATINCKVFRVARFKKKSTLKYVVRSWESFMTRVLKIYRVFIKY